MFTRMIAVLAILIAGTAPALAKRVALVIGNGAYEHTIPLPNPSNDAELMAAKLRSLGFEVVAGQDQTYNDMRRSVLDFAKKAYGAEIAVLFYAGHGMQVGGQNLLIPIDAKIEDETSLDFETISVDFIMRQMSKDVKVQMVFLDACRDNPLARTLARRMGPSRSANLGSGLAEIKVEETGGEGSVIAFATSPGDVALDGDGKNSPFTSALIRHIDTPNASIQTVMTRVTGDVYDATEKRQRPWVNASLIGEVFLNKSTASAEGTEVASLGTTTTTVPDQAVTNAAVSAAATTSQPNLDWEREKLIWEAAKSSDTVADYESYLAAYPKGTFADFARNSIKRLSNGAQVAAVNPATTPGAAAAANPTNGAATSLPNPQTAIPGTAETEAALGWNRTARREVQTRLNLAGHNVGRPDGAFGPKTRAGVVAWQTQNGMVPTGFFTAAQHLLLNSQTTAQYTAYIAEIKRKQQAAATSRSTTTRRANTTPQRTTNTTRRTNNGGGGLNPAGAAFIGGVVGGILGGAIGR
ncbi:MAG: caspase family protein [Roseibium album]|uniref:caspase family protein n=1 Tax=Roseibium album TaxID=311410 RepID=UPI0018C9C27B|nr:caspase family protein [Roseibium album]MBG6155987.1 putative caspase-like protein [Labrenzia sp. EL_162]MBG6194521.1 putative caspase-like protein [Labrenzia sp. EL_159]MBG6200546.1 putative caspase-like protein [Labrenzia sp. EL_13]